MKQVFALLLAASAIDAHTQCVVTDLGMDTTAVSAWVMLATPSEGGVLACMEPFGTLNPMLIVKEDSLGVVQWQRFMQHVSSTMSAYPSEVISTSDGGILLGGVLDHRAPGIGYTYSNFYAIKLDASGCTEWSKIFMVQPDTSNGEWWVEPAPDNRIFKEIGGGAFSMVSIHYKAQTWDSTLVHYTTIDPLGQPVSTTALSFANSVVPGPSHFAVEAAANNDLHLMLHQDQQSNYYRLDAQGSLLSSFSLDVLGAWNAYSLRELANGDLLLRSAYRSVRTDPVGAVQWAVEHPASYLNPAEGPGGVLLSADGTSGELRVLDGDGTSIQTWSRPGHDVWSVRADAGSIIVATNNSNWEDDPHVHIVRASDVSDLSCALVAGPTINTVPFSVTPGAALTLPIVTRPGTVVRSWDMAMGQGCQEIQLDTADLMVFGANWGLAPGFHSTVFGSVANAAFFPTDLHDVTMTVPALLAIDSVHPQPTSIVGNTIIWNAQDTLLSFQSQGLQVYVTTPPDPLLIGSQVSFTLTASQSAPEVGLANNTYTFTQTITGSFDPNDKLVRTSSGLNDAEFYPGIDEWLDYTIQFQNTGNDTAFTVVVTDTLPAELSTGTLNILSASHPYTYEFGGNGVLRFTFDNILLPDSNVNEALSHGLVSFRIKPDNGLPLGTAIANRADIFFDFNPPIRTPDAVVTISMPTALPELHSEELLIYPVPVREVLIAQLPEGFAIRRVEIRSSDGRLVRTPNLSPMNNRLDVGLQGLVPGVYVLSVEGLQGQRLTARFIKE